MIPIVDPSTRVPVGCYGKADFVLPDHALSQLSKMIPNLLRPQWGGALYQLAKVVFTIVASYFVLVNLPWFLLPIGWILVASSLTGLFAIAHDCSHDNYTPSSLINRLIGEIASLPLLQSFEVFKLRHSKTHATKMKALAAKNNKSSDDKQSLLLSEEDKKKAKKAELLQEERAEMLEETPIGSLVSFISDTFFPSLSAVSNRCSFIFSLSLSYLFFVAAIPALCYFIGFSLVVKFYFIPLICFYAMRSSFFSMLYTKFTNAMLPMSLSASIPSYSIRSVCKEILKVQEETRTSLSSFSIRDYISWFKNDIYPRLDWLHVIILFSVPIFGFYGATFTPLLKPTLYFSIFYYMCSGLGITAGYHRLFAHKAFEASPFWTVILGLMGTSALEGSIKWWCGGHRVHHRHTDTDKDPYNAKAGFWYAHIGWMLVKQKAEHRVKSDISDLNRSAFIRFQHKYYLFVGPFMAIIFPTLVCGLLWGDWQGGYFYAGLIRLFFVHHSTFCVNSVAHYLGEQSFDDMRTPRDSLITAFLTFGEGYHNFHHEFPNDYRNGIRWYDYDPTKWLILALHYIGSAFHLKKFSENEIRMGQWLMKQKQADELKENILFPAPVDNLPEWSMEEVTEKVNNQSSKLIIIHGLIYDIEEFIPMHPGGAAHLTTSVGKDASDKFEGKSGIYKHSNAARNFLQRYRVAKLAGAKVIDHVKQD